MRWSLWVTRRIVGVVGLSSWVWLSNAAGATSTLPTLAPSDPHPEVQATVLIRSRQFEPGTVRLQVGQKTKLVFRNQDAELHAFVPVGLLNGTHFSLSGNGAPDFGPEGLRRVLLPAEGHTALLFVPQHPGIYPFFCDLPGHVMNGTIVVEE